VTPEPEQIMTEPLPIDAAALLTRDRPVYLDFLIRKLHDPALAEDVLQDAMIRGLQNAHTLRDEGALGGWFFRILRNAAIDHHRRSATRGRALEQLAHELEDPRAMQSPPSGRTCACVSRLHEQLKPEYAEALQRIDVEGQSVSGFATEKGISAGNAGVRVHRARRVLRDRVSAACGACADDGCTDCSCAAPELGRASAVPPQENDLV